MKRLMTAMMVAGLLGCPITSSQAERVGINATRIIYRADSYAATALLRNSSKEAVYLMQVTVSSIPDGSKDCAIFSGSPPVSYGTRQPESGEYHQNRPGAAC
ncbi:fimbria/pilus periplasmic chaperone [Photorhabdus laumondii]|uniref:fimbria/pilus periplasmic chaperone n=1 Tax=Photorhabdus laumondii TaxID=2218628 RepID=UPI0025B1BC78|nr:fimbria/pilus periplasmic chaperone [Photorhabdus laumondii]